MTWVKLDDTCPDHPAIVGLSDAAFACWIRGLCYSSRHLTDGLLPRTALRSLGTPKAAKELVAAGRWEPVDGGWRVHGYEEKQRTRAEVEQQRGRAARRQTLHRDPALKAAIRSRDQECCRYCGVRVDWTDRRGRHGGTYDHINPDGPETLENLVVACRACNGGKCNRTPEQAGMPLRPIPNQVGTKNVSEADLPEVETEAEVETDGCTSSAAATTSPDHRLLLLEAAAAIIGDRAAQRPGTRDPGATARAVARGVLADRHQDAYAAIAATPTITADELAQVLEPIEAPPMRAVLPPTYQDPAIADLEPPPAPRIPDEARAAGLATVAALRQQLHPPDDAA